MVNLLPFSIHTNIEILLRFSSDQKEAGCYYFSKKYVRESLYYRKSLFWLPPKGFTTGSPSFY